jgi:hypothetical protein
VLHLDGFVEPEMPLGVSAPVGMAIWQQGRDSQRRGRHGSDQRVSRGACSMGWIARAVTVSQRLASWQGRESQQRVMTIGAGDGRVAGIWRKKP